MFLTPLQTRLYVGTWVTACVVATYFVARDWRSYAFLRSSYLRHLTSPVRLVPFVFAFAFFCLAAPYVGDPTWDRANGGAMALFTYLTAPFCVGAIFRVLNRRLAIRQGFVALVGWLFSASFCYDGYLLWRDGRYPQTFLWNLVASSAVYLCAGVMFSVFSPGGKSVALVFRAPEWFDHEDARRVGRRAIAFGLVVVSIIIAAMVPFLESIAREIRSR